MIIINHRINNIEGLEMLPPNQGIEVDVRYHKGDLILHHDPFNHHIGDNTKLSAILASWKNTGPIILNLKSGN